MGGTNWRADVASQQLACEGARVLAWSTPGKGRVANSGQGAAAASALVARMYVGGRQVFREELVAGVVILGVSLEKVLVSDRVEGFMLGFACSGLGFS